MIKIHEIQIGKKYSFCKIDFICTEIGYTKDKICRYFKGDVLSGGKIYQEFNAKTTVLLFKYD